MPTVSVPSSGSGQASVSNGAKLITIVARPFGLEDDAEGRALVCEAIDQALRELQGRAPLWEFLRTNQTITLVNGTATYDLNSDFLKEGIAQLMDSSTREYSKLIYYDYEQFQDYVGQQTRTGNPEIYMFRSAYLTGQVEVYPVPDSSAATNYTLRLTYYKRLGTCSDDASSSLSAPVEVEPWIVTRSKAIVASSKSEDKYPVFQAEAIQQWGKLIAYDRRHTDGHNRFRIPGTHSPTGTTLIRVGDGYLVV